SLFLRWGALLHGKDALKLDTSDADFNNIFHLKDVTAFQTHGMQWPFVVRTLYQSGAQADAYVNRSRLMFVFAGVALGALVGWWGWRLGGWLAAVTATLLYCLDPNFLAHAGIIKNDVPLALLMLWMTAALWMLGRRI